MRPNPRQHGNQIPRNASLSPRTYTTTIAVEKLVNFSNVAERSLKLLGGPSDGTEPQTMDLKALRSITRPLRATLDV